MTAHCTTKISASLSSKTCSGLTNLTADMELEGCIMDIQVRQGCGKGCGWGLHGRGYGGVCMVGGVVGCAW